MTDLCPRAAHSRSEHPVGEAHGDTTLPTIPSHPIPDTRRLLLMGFAARLIPPSTTSKLLFLDIEGV